MGSCVDFNADEANSWSRGRASARRLLKRLCLPVAVALPGIAGMLLVAALVGIRLTTAPSLLQEARR